MQALCRCGEITSAWDRRFQCSTVFVLQNTRIGDSEAEQALTSGGREWAGNHCMDARTSERQNNDPHLPGAGCFLPCRLWAAAEAQGTCLRSPCLPVLCKPWWVEELGLNVAPLGELASHLESLDDKGVLPAGGGKLFLVNVSLWMQKPTYTLFLQESVMTESYCGPGCERKACLPSLSNSACVCTKCRLRVFAADKPVFRQAPVAA